MTKTSAIERVNKYMRYAATVNVNVKPTTGTHSGAYGNAFERAVKLALGNYRGADHTTKAGQRDTTKKIDGKLQSIEIKQGAGELATLRKDGTIKTTCIKSDWIIYCPSFFPGADVRQCAYVLTMDNFMAAVEKAGLFRFKKSNNQYKEGIAEEERYNDRLAIQTFSTSQKKSLAFENALDEYGKKLGTWMIEKGLA